jgi:hypothetical protein
MNRRQYLGTCGATAGAVLSGCLGAPGAGDSNPTAEVAVSIASQMAQPDAPVAYDVALVRATATGESPARLRVSITNPRDQPIVLGEERDVRFHHIPSDDSALYLYPASDEGWGGPVEPGCWRLTDTVAVADYYGTITLEAGETMTAEADIYGHPALPDGDCLPTGQFHVATRGVVGDSVDSLDDGTDYSWGFTLRLG